VPLLVLGPLLRYVGETEATIWVETDAACEVEVLGRTARTFEVEGHHYALVYVEGLEPNTVSPYTVTLDGEQKWPEPDYPFPQPVIRTPKAHEPIRMAWGSCRVCAPHQPPHSLKKDEDEQGREIDALYAYAARMLKSPHEQWPHVLLLLGDQVYADEVSPLTREFIRSRRDVSEPPGEEVADFEEYCHLYQESWRDPVIRWLFSTVSTAMIWDDHDVHDDWNTSQSWLDEMREHHWWNERITAAVMTYWLYQHWGNLSPRELEDDTVHSRVCNADGDAGPLLRELAFKADRHLEGTRWSYCRDIGASRLIVMDSRGGRVLDGDGRQMVDDHEWCYIEEHASEGGFNHLILATTLPVLLPPAMHYLEAWDEAIAGGAWGARCARFGEKLRRGLDLEHWAAFQKSFHRVVELVREVGSGRRGEPPASIVFLSGDVHNAYLEQGGFRREDGMRSAVWQGVCSPFRNPLDTHERLAVKLASSRPVGVLTKALAKRAGVREPEMGWRMDCPPAFDNQIATLDWNGRQAKMTLEKSVPGDPLDPRLELTFERELA
jgi:hypothetical protein